MTEDETGPSQHVTSQSLLWRHVSVPFLLGRTNHTPPTLNVLATFLPIQSISTHKWLSLLKMTILTKPLPTSSYQSWTDLSACGRVIVQRRTGEGLAKNASIAHRLAFTATDQFPFRIILVAGPTAESYGAFPGTAKLRSSHDNDKGMEKAGKYVLATAQSRGEILADWEELRAALRWTADVEDLTVPLEGTKWASLLTGHRLREPAPAEPTSPAVPVNADATRSMSPEAEQPPQAKATSTVQGAKVAPPARNGLAAPNSTNRVEGVPMLSFADELLGPFLCVLFGQWGVETLLVDGFALVLWTRTAKVTGSFPLFPFLFMVWLVAFIARRTLRREASFSTGVYQMLHPRHGSGNATPDAPQLPPSMRRLLVQLVVACSLPSFGLAASWVTPAYQFATCHVIWRGLALGSVRFLIPSKPVDFDKRPQPKSAAVMPHPADALAASTEKMVAYAEPVAPTSSTPAATTAIVPPMCTATSSDAEVRNDAVASVDKTIPEAATRALGLVNEPNWTLAKEAKGVVWKTKPSPWSDKTMCLFTMADAQDVTVPAVAAIVFDDPDGTKGRSSNVYKFDRLLKERRILGYLQTGEFIAHSKFTTPTRLVKARDFVSFGCQVVLSEREQKAFGLGSGRLPNGKVPLTWMYATRDGSSHVPADPGYQRGTLNCFGFIAQETTRGVRIWMVMAMDPRGSIPASLVNAANAEQIEKLNTIVDLARELLQQVGREGLPESSILSLYEKRVGRVNLSEEPLSAEPVAVAAASSPLVPLQPDDAVASQLKSETVPEASLGPAKRVAALEEPLVRALSLWKASGWQQRKIVERVTFRTMASPWCGKQACWFSTDVGKGASPCDVEAVVCDDLTGTKGRASAIFVFDRLLDARELLRVHSADGRETVWHTCYKSPVAGVGPRDMVTRFIGATYLSEEQQREFCIPSIATLPRRDMKEGGVFLQAAIDHGKREPAYPKFVRGAVHSFAIIGVAAALPGDPLQLHMVMSIDPQGWLPGSIVDMTNEEQIQKVLIIKRLVEEAAEKRRAQS